MKHRYTITVNKAARGRNTYAYSFGRTKDIRMSLVKDGVTIRFEMSVLRTPEDFSGLRVNVFRDALRKAYLLHTVIYDSALTIRSISLDIDGTVTVFDKTTPHFPFVFSMLEYGKYSLGNIRGDPDVIRAILSDTKTSSAWDEKYCALYSYMLSTSRQYEMDRFLSLWTSMNSLYNLLAIRFENCIGKEASDSGTDIPKKYRIHRKDNPSIGALICLMHPGTVLPKNPDDRPEYKTAYRDISRLIQDTVISERDKLYESSLKEMDGGLRDGEFAELYGLADSLNIPLYIFLLIIYPYWLRCNYFHGSKAQPIVAGYVDPEYRDLKLINTFLARFLADNIPKMFGTGELTEHEVGLIKEYIKAREK